MWKYMVMFDSNDDGRALIPRLLTMFKHSEKGSENLLAREQSWLENLIYCRKDSMDTHVGMWFYLSSGWNLYELNLEEETFSWTRILL